MRFELNEALAVLGRTPDVLATLLEGLPPGWVEGTEGPDTWSPYDVVGHLIHGERTDWITRTRMILEKGKAEQFEPFDRTAMFRESKGKTLAQLLAEFAALRKSNLETLRGWGLTAADLDRKGVHPALGEVTLRQLLATWVAHDLGHIVQIARVMAKQYRDEVGPWGEYLSALEP